MTKLTFLTILILFWAPWVEAQVYKWVDDRGGVHFTDDPGQIPVRYRSKAEKSEMAESQGEAKAPASPSNEGKATITEKDSLGRGEDYWRGRTREWREKLEFAQENLEKRRTNYNELTEKFNASRGPEQRYRIRQEREQVQQEMNQFKSQIEGARRMLEKTIPEEAQLFKAKPEWVKP